MRGKIGTCTNGHGDQWDTYTLENICIFHWATLSTDLIVQIYLAKDGRIQLPSTTFLSQALQQKPMPLLCYQRRTKVTEASACGFVFCSGVTTEIANQLSNEGLASPSTSGYKLQGSITEKATVMIKYPFLSSVSRDIFFSRPIPETC